MYFLIIIRRKLISSLIVYCRKYFCTMASTIYADSIFVFADIHALITYITIICSTLSTIITISLYLSIKCT